MAKFGSSLYPNFLELAKARKTTYEFTDEKVSDKDLNLILEAGNWAPSCTNTQPWHFIIVKDKKRISELMMTANYGDFHVDPSMIIVLVLLSDRCPGEGYSCFRGKDSMVYDSFMGVGMVCLNMALQARYLGVDSCIVTPTQKTVKKLLKIRKSDAVPLLLGLGYQDPKAVQKARVRRPLSKVLSSEIFGGSSKR